MRIFDHFVDLKRQQEDDRCYHHDEKDQKDDSFHVVSLFDPIDEL